MPESRKMKICVYVSSALKRTFDFRSMDVFSDRYVQMLRPNLLESGRCTETPKGAREKKLNQFAAHYMRL